METKTTAKADLSGVPRFGYEKRLARLADVADVIMGQSPPSEFYNTEGRGMPFFQGKAEFRALYPNTVKWCTFPGKVAQRDDVLISVRAPVGPTNLSPGECCIGRGLAAVRAKPGLAGKYVLYYLRTIEREIEALGTGTTFKAISGQILRELSIPVVTLKEQERIVAEIEKQFSRLDEAVANLKRVKANLKRYRAAVLKAACTGKLGAADCATWTAAPLGRVAAEIRNGYSGKPNATQGTRIFRISAVRPLKLDLGDVRYLSGGIKDYNNSQVTPGDVLFTRYNGSRDFVGVCAVVPECCPPTIHPDKLIRVRVTETILLPEMLAILASVGDARAFLESRIRTTAGQSGISGADLKAMPISYPPLSDQHRIVAEVERRLSMTDESEAQVDANLLRAEGLRRAILKRAFVGNLG
jgi:type I restriction enzyme, S subunit